MKYISEQDLRKNLITDNCDDGCGYLDERDIPSLPWIELDEDEKERVGHWIIYKGCEGKTRQCTCDQCGYKTGKYTWHNPNFCAECGCRMVEQQKSER